MFKTGAPANGATAIAAVGAELGCGVAALAGQRRLRQQLAYGVPCAHIAHRVGACGFAYGRLVNKHHIVQQFRAQQTVVRARGFGGLAKEPQQGRSQHVLNQGGFARARHPRNAHQAPQRDFYRHVVQVVLVHAL